MKSQCQGFGRKLSGRILTVRDVIITSRAILIVIPFVKTSVPMFLKCISRTTVLACLANHTKFFQFNYCHFPRDPAIASANIAGFLNRDWNWTMTTFPIAIPCVFHTSS